jgi:hypothetical protein
VRDETSTIEDPDDLSNVARPHIADAPEDDNPPLSAAGFAPDHYAGADVADFTEDTSMDDALDPPAATDADTAED